MHGKEEPSVNRPNILQRLHLELIVSIILVLAGISEAYESFDNLKSFSLRAHHGIVIFGLFHMFKAVIEAVESSKKIKKKK